MDPSARPGVGRDTPSRAPAQVETSKGHRGKRGRRKKSVERLTRERHAIWRERAPRRYGDEQEPILSDDELRARDWTREIRTTELAGDLRDAYTRKLDRRAR